MKERLTKIIVTFAALALAVPFLAAALLVGARAVAGAENMQDNLLLVALACAGAAASVVKNVTRRAGALHGETSLRIAPSRRRLSRNPFMHASS
jgi:hypothetical protein